MIVVVAESLEEYYDFLREHNIKENEAVRVWTNDSVDVLGYYAIEKVLVSSETKARYTVSYKSVLDRIKRKGIIVEEGK